MPTPDGRRWIPEEGLKKHKQKIQYESKLADKKNLPYKISKPPARKSFTGFRCAECGYQFSGSRNTVMVICPNCKKLTRCEELNE